MRSNHMENTKSEHERMKSGMEAKYKLKEIEQNYEMEENQEFYVLHRKIKRLRSNIRRHLDLIR